MIVLNIYLIRLVLTVIMTCGGISRHIILSYSLEQHDKKLQEREAECKNEVCLYLHYLFEVNMMEK